MSKTRTKPMKRVEIRNYAIRLRRFLGFEDREFIQITKLFDSLSVYFSDLGFKFDYKVLPDNDDAFIKRQEAFTDMTTGIVYIKESVMEDACKGNSRGVITLAHELGHFCIHFIQGTAILSRVPDNELVPTYCDPEWQADTFASEFLMPYAECIEMSSVEIQETYHVSKKAAKVRESGVKKENPKTRS